MLPRGISFLYFRYFDVQFYFLGIIFSISAGALTHVRSVTLGLPGTWLNMWHGLRRTAGRPEPLSIKYFNTQALLKFIHGRF